MRYVAGLRLGVWLNGPGNGLQAVVQIVASAVGHAAKGRRPMRTTGDVPVMNGLRGSGGA
jgi:hypothetical protein